jgi:hypothetical protein
VSVKQLFLHPSAARTASGTTPAMEVDDPSALVFVLETTAHAGTAPTLDMKIQTTVDGTNWDDIAAFAQVTTTDGRRYLYLNCMVVSASPEHAEADGTLAAATVRNGPVGLAVRGKYVITGSAGQSFTLALTGIAHYD